MLSFLYVKYIFNVSVKFNLLNNFSSLYIYCYYFYIKIYLYIATKITKEHLTNYLKHSYKKYK